MMGKIEVEHHRNIAADFDFNFRVCQVENFRPIFSHMPDYDLRFSTCATDDAGTYKLLELPPDLVQLVGKAEDSSRTLV